MADRERNEDLTADIAPAMAYTHEEVDAPEDEDDRFEGGSSAKIAALDDHTKKFLNMAATAVKSWKADPPTADDIRPPKNGCEEPLPKADLPFANMTLPSSDEDWARQPMKVKLYLRYLRTFDLQDHDAEFDSNEEGRAAVHEVLPVGEILSEPNHHYDELSSDAAMSRLAFAGLGALRLLPVDDPASDPDGAAWVHDTSYLAGLDVRQGFEKYGCKVFFNAKQEIVRIYWCHADDDVRPGDRNWEHAKWVWRCSILVGTTVSDHLVTVHWIVANSVVTGARDNFGVDHPLRRMLKPFTWRTVTINYNATFSLLVERGFVHRATALTFDSMMGGLQASVEGFRYHTVPQLVARKGAEAMGDDFPWANDALSLYNTIHDFVESYVDLYYASDADVKADPGLPGFWKVIATGCGTTDDGTPRDFGVPELSKASLIDLLSQFIWTVTGMHEAVGTVIEYIVDPSFMGTKIRPKAVRADVQAFMQCLGVMGLTGLVMPRLLEDFTHVFNEPDADTVMDDIKQLDVKGLAGRIFGKKEEAEVTDKWKEAKGCFADFNRALYALSDEIEAKNKTRKWPCNTFNPRVLETGVSI